MIGFIGLGIMGSRMAENLIKSGHQLVIYNRTKEKAEGLLKQGAVWAETPAELASKADIVFTMLATPDSVEQVVSGDNGLLAHMAKGSLWIDSSTVHPTFSLRMARLAQEKGIRFLDAPVAGSKIPAEKAELTFLVGGAQSDFEEVKPLLEKMGKLIVHVGGHGKGTSLKMVVNLQLGLNMAVFSEAMSLGAALGLDQDLLLGFLPGGPVTAPFIAGKKEKIRTGNYEPEFPLQWLQKDLHLAVESAFERNTALPLTSLAKELYAMARQRGMGEEDFSAIFRYITERR